MLWLLQAMSIQLLSSLQLICIAIELEPKLDISYNFQIHPIRMLIYMDIVPNIFNEYLINSYQKSKRQYFNRWSSTYRYFTIGKGDIFAFSVDFVITVICKVCTSETFLDLTLFRFMNACIIIASSIIWARIFSVRGTLSCSWCFTNTAVFWAIQPITPWAESECAQSRFADRIWFTQEIQCASNVSRFQIWIYNFFQSSIYSILDFVQNI